MDENNKVTPDQLFKNISGRIEAAESRLEIVERFCSLPTGQSLGSILDRLRELETLIREHRNVINRRRLDATGISDNGKLAILEMANRFHYARFRVLTEVAIFVLQHPDDLISQHREKLLEILHGPLFDIHRGNDPMPQLREIEREAVRLKRRRELGDGIKRMGTSKQTDSSGTGKG